MMTVAELYEKLASREFRDPENGNLFYNFFIFPYPAEQEARMRRDIAECKDNLIRPVTYVDALAIDIFETFRDYLGQRSFGRHPSTLHYLLDCDQKAADPAGHEKVTKSLQGYAKSGEFMEFVHAKILSHIEKKNDGKIRPYVFLYGFGAIYPYLRASAFLEGYERLNRANRYKVILFYPGVFHVNENHFSLFGKLHEDHPYRSHVLVN